MAYLRPSAGRPLAVPPVLESWDRAGSPSQLRLNKFLDSVADWNQGLPDESLALDLVVALAPTVSLTSGGNDLDNYLFPLMRRLGHQRFVAVFGRKVHGTTSTLAIHPASAVEADWSPQLVCRTTSAGQSPAWKREISEACAACAGPFPEAGPIVLQVHYRLSARRNWAQQWKPTIDALGPILGISNPARPYNVDDDRIVDLALSRTTDESLGWAIEVSARWSAA